MSNIDATPIYPAMTPLPAPSTPYSTPPKEKPEEKPEEKSICKVNSDLRIVFLFVYVIPQLKKTHQN